MSVHWCIGWRRDASMIVRVLKFRFQPINSIPLPRRRMREWGGRKRYIRRKYIRSGASRTRVARRKACLWIYSLSAKTDNAPRGRLAPGQPLIAPSLVRLCGAAANLARPSRRRVYAYTDLRIDFTYSSFWPRFYHLPSAAELHLVFAVRGDLYVWTTRVGWEKEKEALQRERESNVLNEIPRESSFSELV